MLRIRTFDEIESFNQSIHNKGQLGFVPTMGALHEGHFQLIKQSIKRNDFTMVSIFVNPLQFNKKEDFDKYPSSLDSDLQALEKLGCHAVFTPSPEVVYPKKPDITIHFGSLETRLEGKHRPGHFQGVALVVTKFFNMIRPQEAFFGLKDLQQYLIIKKLVENLSLPISIVGVETSREESGLAMSSRNLRLSKEGRFKAAYIYKGLETLRSKLISGEKNYRALKEETLGYYQAVKELEIEYLEIVDPATLEAANENKHYSEVAVCVAGYVEGVRLIDNLYLRSEMQSDADRGIKI